MEVQTIVGIDLEQVRSGDIIGCDYDGLFGLPDAVTAHAKAILVTNIKARRKRYESPNIPFDKTTDRERAEAYYEEPE